MSAIDWSTVGPDEVLDFWFPDEGYHRDFEAHQAFRTWRMRGGADDAIRARFTELTEAVARGGLDHWSATPRSRLA